MSLQRTYGLATVDIPYLDDTSRIGRSQQLAIRGKSDAPTRLPVPGHLCSLVIAKRGTHIARGPVSQYHKTVLTCRRQQRAIGRKVERPDVFGLMDFEASFQRLGRDVPNENLVTLAGGCDTGAVGSYRERTEWARCAREFCDLFACGRIPNPDRLVIPGGNEAASRCHLARCVCRRAERQLIHLSHQAAVNSVSVRYVNRLSDLLFVIARVLARRDGGVEVTWRKGI